jgi:hypothetical protein
MAAEAVSGRAEWRPPCSAAEGEHLLSRLLHLPEVHDLSPFCR